MPISRKDPYRPRKCRLCKLTFKPSGKNPKNAAEQDFCCPAHRKEFWKHGALPFQKLMHRLEKRMREIAREEIAAADRFNTEMEFRIGGYTPPEELEKLRANARGEARAASL
jgi:hypothetical protein